MPGCPMPNKAVTHEVSTSWGTIKVNTVDGKVVDCTLPRVDTLPGTPFAIGACGEDQFSKFVVAVLNGREKKVPALGSLAGTDFQREVWGAIASIQHGETASYAELAKLIGRSAAYRAVANACGANPVPLFTPCHRVVGANNTLGGFSSGLAWKRLILSAEGCPFN